VERRGAVGNVLAEPSLTSLTGTAAEKDPFARLLFLATKVVPPPRLGLIDGPRLLAMASQLAAKWLAVIAALTTRQDLAGCELVGLASAARMLKSVAGQ
jgi:hypothetical protein